MKAEDYEPLDADMLALLAQSAAPIAPRPAARESMRRRVLELSDDGTEVLRAEEGEWLALAPGIDVRHLRRDCEDDCQTALWRLAAGAEIPAHVHRRDEECLVLKGSVQHAGSEYRAGDFLLARAGTRQLPVVSPGGALLLIRGEIHG